MRSNWVRMDTEEGGLAGGLKSFCGESFWVGWQSKTPEIRLQDPRAWTSPYLPTLTQCFHHTALVWIPFAATFFISPILTTQLAHQPKQQLPWTRLLRAKIVGFLGESWREIIPGLWMYSHNRCLIPIYIRLLRSLLLRFSRCSGLCLSAHAMLIYGRSLLLFRASFHTHFLPQDNWV